MKRWGASLSLVAIVAFFFAGCATSPPGGSNTPTPSPVVAPPTSASPSPDTSQARMVLSATGIGNLKFGASQAEAEKALKAVLGPSTGRTTDGGGVEVTGRWTELVQYGGLAVSFEAKNAKSASPRTFSSWSFSVNHKLPKGLAIDQDIPLDLSFKQLAQKYPSAKFVDTGIPGTKALLLPNKLYVTGDTKPIELSSDLQGGE